MNKFINLNNSAVTFEFNQRYMYLELRKAKETHDELLEVYKEKKKLYDSKAATLGATVTTLEQVSVIKFLLIILYFNVKWCCRLYLINFEFTYYYFELLITTIFFFI